MKVKTNTGFEFYLIEDPDEGVLWKSIKNINKNIQAGCFKYLMRRHPFPDSVVDEWHEEQVSGKAVRVVGLNEIDEVISTAYLYRGHGKAFHSAKLGITVDPCYQGKGVAYSTCENLLALGKDQGIRRVESQPVIENTSAIELLARLGFLSEGMAINKFKMSESCYLDCAHMAKEL